MPRVLPGEGSTLLVPSGPRRHLFVVLTKPAGSKERILMVGINSIHDDQYHDPACILYAGDHPFITRPSFIAYRFAKIVDGDRVRHCLETGYFTLREPVSQEVFEKICHGLVMSRHTRPSVSTFYANRPD